MKNRFEKIYFCSLILFLFSCQKNRNPTSLPKGYYEIYFKYDNGIDPKSEVVKFSESNNERIVMHNYIDDTLIVQSEKISGNINIEQANQYKINAIWSYDKKEKEYSISGTFKHTSNPTGEGTFEMIKAE